MTAARNPRLRVLAADIGGTHARLAIAHDEGRRIVFERHSIVAVRDHAGPAEALATFLRGAAVPARACIAWAGPIEGERARLTNGAWQADARALAARFAIDEVMLVNDFHAAAAGVDRLGDDDVAALQAGTADPRGTRLVIGAGTGLGVAYALHDAHGTRILAGEGGHVAFAPADDEQVALLQHCRRELARVTAEHVVSGGGIVRLYGFCCARRGLAVAQDVADLGAAAVAQRADAGEPAAVDALRLFCAIFGAVAGDHALSCLATGGVYVAGGVATRIAARIADGTFVAAFRDKAAHARLVARMPAWLVRDELLGLRGAASIALERAAASVR